MNAMLVSMSVYNTCAWYLWEAREALQPLKLELGVVASNYIGAED